MKKKSKLKIMALFFVLLNLVTFLAPITNSLNKLSAKTTEELQAELDELNRQLTEIANQKNNLQSQLDSNGNIISGYNSQLSKLYNETAIINKEVEQLDAETKQLQIQIEILNSQITTKKEEITQTEDTIKDLEEESEIRIKDGYYNYRIYDTGGDAGTTLFNLTNINSYFKASQYKEIIQSETNDLMVQVAELKQSLQDKKKQLDLDVIAVNKDKEILDVKKTDLSKKKEEADAKVALYLVSIGEAQAANQVTKEQIDNVTSEENQRKAQANLIQQEIFSSYVPPNAGQLVLAGQYIGKQGCTGYCFGQHVHFMVGYGGCGYSCFSQNPCNYLQPGVVSGCGGGSLEWPLRGTPSFNQGYSAWHTAIDISGAPNSPVFASQDGYAHQEYDCYHYNLGLADSCAKVVIICDNQSCTGLNTGYWHLSEF